MYRRILKRWIDIAVSSLSLPLLSPFFLFVAGLIKLESKGPVLFRQTRCGQGASTFTLLKFRSMRVDQNAERKGFEPGSNRRITVVGGFLRKTKFDELPQLFNVLKGDMSLVGPRPEVPRYMNCYPERWRKVRSIRPGITDPASVIFRNEEELLAKAENPAAEYENNILPQKLDLYERYVSNITFVGDMRIIFSTIFAVFIKSAAVKNIAKNS